MRILLLAVKIRSLMKYVSAVEILLELHLLSLHQISDKSRRLSVKPSLPIWQLPYHRFIAVI